LVKKGVVRLYFTSFKLRLGENYPQKKTGLIRKGINYWKVPWWKPFTLNWGNLTFQILTLIFVLKISGATITLEGGLFV